MLEHLADCASCYAMFSGVVAFQAEEAGASAQGEVRALPGRGGGWTRLALAAALVTAVGAAWITWSLLRPGLPDSAGLVAGLEAPPAELVGHLWPGTPTRGGTDKDFGTDRQAFRIGAAMVELRTALAAGDTTVAGERLRRLAVALDAVGQMDLEAELYADARRRLGGELAPADFLPEAARVEREIDELGRFREAYLGAGKWVAAARLAALTGDVEYLRRRATRRMLERWLAAEDDLREPEVRDALGEVAAILRRRELSDEDLVAVAGRLEEVLRAYDRAGAMEL